MQLLEYGAAVDAVDAQKGRTALHRAIKGSVMMYPMDAKIVTLLLDSGANPFCADKKGQSVFPNLSVSIPNLSVSVPNLSVSMPYLSSPSRLLLLLMSLLAPTPGSKDPSSSHQACKQADFLLLKSFGYSFPQIQLYEHVHRVQPLMRRHLGKQLQDSLLACSDHELLNRQFLFRNAIPTLEI